MERVRGWWGVARGCDHGRRAVVVVPLTHQGENPPKPGSVPGNRVRGELPPIPPIPPKLASGKGVALPVGWPWSAVVVVVVARLASSSIRSLRSL